MLIMADSNGQFESQNTETGAKTWESETAGVSFSLTQLLPDQLRAFYVNRGFSLAQIEPYAKSCVFMTVLRNDTAEGVVHFLPEEWTVFTQGEAASPMALKDWLKIFQLQEVSKSALLAFRWAQFPPEQEYQPGGDWNQGMLAMGLKPGQLFNLIVRWNVEDKLFEGILENVQCAQ